VNLPEVVVSVQFDIQRRNAPVGEQPVRAICLPEPFGAAPGTKIHGPLKGVQIREVREIAVLFG
jgi:hypothetical protein